MLKKIFVGVLVVAMIGGLVGSVVRYWPSDTPKEEGDDPFADVPYPIIGSYRYADLAGQDASTADLSAVTDYGTFTFDTSTVWPAAEKMPADFSPEALLDEGRYLGLGLAGLHDQGVDGSGVSVAMIDTPLLAGHEALPSGLIYVDDLLGDVAEPEPTFHGVASAAIMTGVDGVAPKAKMYYYAVPDGDNLYASSIQAMEKIIEVNSTLPEGERVRIVVAAQAVDPLDQATQVSGAQDWARAISRAMDAGITVLYPGMDYPSIAGAGVIPGMDRDDPANYRQWSWTTAKQWAVRKLKAVSVNSWETARAELVRLLTEEPDLDSLQAQALNTYIYLIEMYKDAASFDSWFSSAEEDLSDSLAVPVDCLTVPTANGSDQYAYFGSGGLSWGSAYLGGLFALGIQVNPSATTADLLEALTESATPFATGGKLVNPVGFVEALRQAP